MLLRKCTAASEWLCFIVPPRRKAIQAEPSVAPAWWAQVCAYMHKGILASGARFVGA